MEIKIGTYNLRNWQAYRDKDIVIGTMVCLANSKKTLGIITDIISKENFWPRNKESEIIVKDVEVFWMTGSRKGSKQNKETSDLVNYDAYKEAVYNTLKKLEDNEAAAKKTGM